MHSADCKQIKGNGRATHKMMEGRESEGRGRGGWGEREGGREKVIVLSAEPHGMLLSGNKK